MKPRYITFTVGSIDTEGMDVEITSTLMRRLSSEVKDLTEVSVSSKETMLNSRLMRADELVYPGRTCITKEDDGYAIREWNSKTCRMSEPTHIPFEELGKFLLKKGAQLVKPPERRLSNSRYLDYQWEMLPAKEKGVVLEKFMEEQDRKVKGWAHAKQEEWSNLSLDEKWESLSAASPVQPDAKEFQTTESNQKKLALDAYVNYKWHTLREEEKMAVIEDYKITTKDSWPTTAALPQERWLHDPDFSSLDAKWQALTLREKLIATGQGVAFSFLQIQSHEQPGKEEMWLCKSCAGAHGRIKGNPVIVINAGTLRTPPVWDITPSDTPRVPGSELNPTNETGHYNTAFEHLEEAFDNFISHRTKIKCLPYTDFTIHTEASKTKELSYGEIEVKKQELFTQWKGTWQQEMDKCINNYREELKKLPEWETIQPIFDKIVVKYQEETKKYLDHMETMLKTHLKQLKRDLQKSSRISHARKASISVMDSFTTTPGISLLSETPATPGAAMMKKSSIPEAGLFGLRVHHQDHGSYTSSETLSSDDKSRGTSPPSSPERKGSA